MLMVVPNEGKERLLSTALSIGGDAMGDIDVKLYQNDYFPVDASIAADFTESTFTGYLEVTIHNSDWGGVSIVSDVAQVDVSFTVQFTCTGGSPQDAYGWYAVEVASGKVLFAQRFDATRTMAPGAVESLDPFRIKLKSFA